MIDNFNIIESNLLEFESGSFYIFQCLIRNTDGENPLYENGYSNTNKNILIKSWFIDSQEYYNKVKNQMKTLCDITGARLYVNLDRKSILKTFISVLSRVNEININLIRGQFPSIKKLQKLIISCASLVESSERNKGKILFDVDCKDPDLLKAVIKTIPVNSLVLESKKGYHVVSNLFNTDKFMIDLLYNLDQITAEELRLPNSFLIDNVSYNKNELGLVYIK